MTKDEGCAIYAVARLEKVFTVDLFFSRFLQKTYGQPISQISVAFVYEPYFCMARQEVKPTLKFGFQVYRQFFRISVLDPFL